jgi:hypothetical protein
VHLILHFSVLLNFYFTKKILSNAFSYFEQFSSSRLSNCCSLFSVNYLWLSYFES